MFNIFKKTHSIKPEEQLENDCLRLNEFFRIYRSGYITLVDGLFIQYKRSWLSKEITIPLDENLIDDELKSFFIEQDIKANELRILSARIVENIRVDHYRVLEKSKFFFTYMYNNPTNYYVRIELL